MSQIIWTTQKLILKNVQSRKTNFLFTNVNMFDIIFENIGINTEYCFDSNESDEFKCECNEGFDGKRCEDECSLDCGINESCTTEINSTTGIKEWKCLWRDNFTGFIDDH